MYKNIITLTVILLTSFNIYAQKYELGKVTIEELQEKRHPKDSSANAAIIYEKGKTYFEYRQGDGFSVLTDIEVKIKVYKKEGYEWANKSVVFYVGGNTDQNVSFSKAITYNLVNGAIEKTKLKSDGEFIEKKNKFWSLKKITMPNVKEGSIIEYKYILKSPYLSTFPDWDFQKSIPVNHSEYTTNIPEYYTYNVYRKGFITPIEFKTKLNKTITLNEKSISGIGGKAYDHTSQNIEYADNQTTYKLDNIPALKEESYVNNINNYITSVQHELSSKQMPQSAFELFSTNWEAVTKTIYEDDDFGSQLNKTGYFEDDINALMSGLTTRDEKISAVFNFVKSKIKWNEYYGYTCDDGVKKAYQDKTGNVAEINLMLTAMLRHAGINANPVLLSTRSNGISLFPSRTAFNYVIAGVEIKNDIILLDATSKNSVPDILPTRDLNWQGRIIRKDGSSAQVDLIPKMISKDHINLMATIDSNGEVNGKIKEQYLDYNASSFRDQYSDLSKETYLEKLEKKYNNIEVTEYEVTNKNELDKPVIETYSFKTNNTIEIIGDKMYFSPLLFLATTENPFKQETREYPIDFTYPNQDKCIIIITIPDGYVVESIPSPINIGLIDNMVGFKFNISNTGKQIQISSILDINTSIISSEYYGDIKAFFTEMMKKQTERIVLKKG
ncbi:transglutaminase domain-containing protein [Flavobacterium sp.]|uniref:DUF3857 domain-containing protein n=1 Tax=Flavobacterium sp. TaxID=239 RepID=UPI00374D6DD5